jgi:hypothetical protein
MQYQSGDLQGFDFYEKALLSDKHGKKTANTMTNNDF